MSVMTAIRSLLGERRNREPEVNWEETFAPVEIRKPPQSRLDTVDINEFRSVFLRSGWRGIERNYGMSSAVLMQLIAKAGGPELLAERRAVQRTGRKAGGRMVEVAGG